MLESSERSFGSECNELVVFVPCSVLSKLARAQGGVRSHWGFTEKFTAPGGPHLGHHHLPPIPRCRHHTPGVCRPRRAHLRSQRYAQHIYLRTPRVLGWRVAGALCCLLKAVRADGRCLVAVLLAPRAAEMDHRHSRGLRGFWQYSCTRSNRLHLGVFTAPPGVFHGSRPGPRCAAPGASRAWARPHMWGSQ